MWARNIFCYVTILKAENSYEKASRLHIVKINTLCIENHKRNRITLYFCILKWTREKQTNYQIDTRINKQNNNQPDSSIVQKKWGKTWQTDIGKSKQKSPIIKLFMKWNFWHLRNKINSVYCRWTITWNKVKRRVSFSPFYGTWNSSTQRTTVHLAVSLFPSLKLPRVSQWTPFNYCRLSILLKVNWLIIDTYPQDTKKFKKKAKKKPTKKSVVVTSREIGGLQKGRERNAPLLLYFKLSFIDNKLCHASVIVANFKYSSNTVFMKQVIRWLQ